MWRKEGGELGINGAGGVEGFEGKMEWCVWSEAFRVGIKFRQP